MATKWMDKLRGKPEVQAKDKGRDSNTEEENEILDEAQQRFEVARSAKVDQEGEPLHTKWRRLDKIYRGQQHKHVDTDIKSNVTMPYTFSLVESIVPRMTDTAPEVLVMARRNAENNKLAENLTQIHKYLWYVNKMQSKMSSAIRTCMKIGTVIYKGYWDPDYLDGVGEVRYSVVHPMNFFPDPRAYDIDQMDYCFTSVPKSLEYLIRRFPEKGDILSSDVDWAHTEEMEGSLDTQEEIASLKEYWFRDEDGNLCVMYYVGDVVLSLMGGKYDGSNEPFYRHNKFPFVKQVDYEADKEFWGIGEVEIVACLQELVNDFEAQIVDNTRLMANAQWIVNKQASGLTEEDAWVFTNEPGSVVWTQGGGVEKLLGSPMPAHVAQHQEQLIFAMEHVLGIHDVVQGRKPSGVRAASAIIALQEAANVRVRQKARNLEHTLVSLAEMANSLVLEFYEEPRTIRIGGPKPVTTLDVREALDEEILERGAEMGLVPEGTTPDMMPLEMPLGAPAESMPEVPFEPTPGMEPDTIEGIGADIMTPTPPPPPQPEMGVITMDDVRQEVKFPIFDVEVKVGPSVPYSQALLWEQAKELAAMQIIKGKHLLKMIGFPGWEEIVEEMEAETHEEERIGERR